MPGWPEPNAAARLLDRHAAPAEHPLGVVARRAWLGHGDFDAGDEAGEEDCALYLRARGLVLPVDRSQRPAVHDHRQSLAALELDACAHGLAWARDPPHRSPTQARV